MADTAPPRQRNPRGQGDMLREDLIQAALTCMAREGNRDAVSLRGVAKAARVSPTAAYRHFEDREALIEAACQACFEEFSHHMLTATSSPSDPFERLRVAGQAYVAYAKSQDGHYRVLFSNPAKFQSEEFATAPDPAGTAFQQLVSLVTDCIAAGAQPRPSTDPTYLAFLVWTWIHGMCDLALSHPHLPWPDIDLMTHDMMVALGLDGPGSPPAG